MQLQRLSINPNIQISSFIIFTSNTIKFMELEFSHFLVSLMEMAENYLEELVFSN